MTGALVLAVTALSGLGATPAAAEAPQADPRVVRGEVIARFEPAATVAARSRAVASVGGRPAAKVDGLARTRLVDVPAGRSEVAAARSLARQRGVEWAEPNYIGRLAATPDDPRFPELWGMRNVGQDVDGTGGLPGFDVGALTAWDRVTGGTLVAVVDSGIDATHPDIGGNLRPDLSRNFVPGANAVVAPGAWQDGNEHGTHVAGTIGAVGDNGVGVAGVAWDADIAAVRACDAAGACTTAAVAEALAYAGSIGAKVANASLGIPKSLAVEAAIAANPGTLYVVAAGNEGEDVDADPASGAFYPCAHPLANIVCVAAIGQDGGLAPFSNFGAASVDVGAPGTNILSTVPQVETPFEDDLAGGQLDLWTEEPADSWYVATYRSGQRSISFEEELTPVPEQSTLTADDPVSLDGLEQCRLSYVLRLDTVEGAQRLFVEAAEDGGEWKDVQQIRDGYSGSTGGQAVPRSEDLSSFDGEDDLRLRFRLAVDSSATGDAATIDLFDVRVVCIGSQPPGGAYAFLQGTSMASPHVAGIAALAWGAHPGASVAEMRAALLDSAVPTDSLSEGATVTGGRANAARVLAALDPPPTPTPTPAPPAPPAPPVTPAAGAALGVAATRRLAANRQSGRVRARVRCRTVRAGRCSGRIALIARVEPPRRAGARGRGRPARRVVLGSRRYAVRKGRTATRALWLRPRAARLLRAGRLAGVALRIATRQPAGADPGVRRHAVRVHLRTARAPRRRG